MELRIHSTFQKTLQREFLILWLVGAFSIGSSIYFLKHDYKIIGLVLALVFSFFCFGGPAYLFYKLHHVSCLVCNGKTKTTKDLTKTQWVAVCSHCQIEWDLQTGASGD